MIRVLIVDDSSVVRKVLSQQLSQFPDIEVAATAADPYMARDLILEIEPDVLTLDIEMPRMDGLTFLVKLMKYHPLPVVIVSSLTPRESPLALKALRSGAVEVVAKPSSQHPPDGKALAWAIRAAHQSRLHVVTNLGQGSQVMPTCPTPSSPNKILAIGASTGGTNALEEVLGNLPEAISPTLIVQHMPKNFTKILAERLDAICRMKVKEARNGDPVIPGQALLAPGGQHMILERHQGRYLVRIKDGPPVHHQCPSVDVLFHSVARVAGKNSVGVILTGMGSDGARGLLAMRRSGAFTLTQNKESCVVFGMPRVAIELKAVSKVVPLDHMAQNILRVVATSGQPVS